MIRPAHHPLWMFVWLGVFVGTAPAGDDDQWRNVLNELGDPVAGISVLDMRFDSRVRMGRHITSSSRVSPQVWLANATDMDDIIKWAGVAHNALFTSTPGRVLGESIIPHGSGLNPVQGISGMLAFSQLSIYGPSELPTIPRFATSNLTGLGDMLPTHNPSGYGPVASLTIPMSAMNSAMMFEFVTTFQDISGFSDSHDSLAGDSKSKGTEGDIHEIITILFPGESRSRKRRGG
jgi:hypothetical protein